MQLVLRLLAVLLLLLGGMPLASASFSATCAPATEEEHHSERAERAETPTRAPAKGELTSDRAEGGPRRLQWPRWLTRRASTPSLAARGAPTDRLSPLRC